MKQSNFSPTTQYREIKPMFNQHTSSLLNQLVGLVVQDIAFTTVGLGSIPESVTSTTVSKTARHHCDTSWEIDAVLSRH